MKAYAIGLLLVPILVVAILSIRPGGIRQQWRNVTRRLRLALILGGIYVGVATVVRFGLLPRPVDSVVLPVLVLGIAIAFVVVGQDRVPERR